MSSRVDSVFVSLQYGQISSDVEYFKNQGVNIIYDQRFDPLKNMDDWLTQVASCDAVVSVANTTIHGAGGLNIPTQCLLSIDSDWRWLKDPAVTRSYWYPSVGIARQSIPGNWEHPFATVCTWLRDGCRMPAGRQFL